MDGRMDRQTQRESLKIKTDKMMKSKKVKMRVKRMKKEMRRKKKDPMQEKEKKCFQRRIKL